MGLKERIESLRETTPKRYSHVYNSGVQDAAQLAAEADELMAEMAGTIEMLRECCTDMGADSEAAHTLHLYNEYKDQSND